MKSIRMGGTFTPMVEKAIKSMVLSAKVTPDIYNAWQKLAESRNTSVSVCLRDAVAMVDTGAMLKANDGIVVPEAFEKTLASIAGGSLIGILAFKGLKSAYTSNMNHDLTEGQIDAISGVLALAAALIVGSGIHSLLDK